MTKQARIVYAGTPDFALPALQSMHNAGYQIVAVYTQPDRPAGRGRRLQASPVKMWAQQQALPVRQPVSLQEVADQQQLAELRPDLMIVAAYGLLLPAAVLAIPVRGCINIHASLLPRWRGAAPIQQAILSGDKQTGISLMQMDEGLDTGGILATQAISLSDTINAAELHDQLAVLGAELLLEQLPMILQGSLQVQPQNNEMATYAGKIKKEDAWLDWSKPAAQLQRQINAFNSWPVAQTRLDDSILRIWQAHTVDQAANPSLAAGAIIQANSQGIDVVCGQGILRITQLQRPGGKPLAAADFINAQPVENKCLGQ